MDKNKPVFKQKHKAVDVSVWMNKGSDGSEFASIKLAKSYKQNGEWKSQSVSFLGRDANIAIALLKRALASQNIALNDKVLDEKEEEN